MASSPFCPRCGGAVLPPSALVNGWQCPTHGQVAPVYPPTTWSPEWFASVIETAQVPVWLPWPLPVGWVVTGAVVAGDARQPGVAAAVMLSGPTFRSGPAELVLVAEEPGVGLGAGYAGLAGPDAEPSSFEPAPRTRVTVGHHESALWDVPAAGDVSAYLGEAAGCWLWAIAWPLEAVLVLHGDVSLVDVRTARYAIEVPLGAPSPRWRPDGRAAAG